MVKLLKEMVMLTNIDKKNIGGADEQYARIPCKKAENKKLESKEFFQANNKSFKTAQSNYQ